MYGPITLCLLGAVLSQRVELLLSDSEEGWHPETRPDYLPKLACLLACLGYGLPTADSLVGLLN
jgi:hypothetical protein